mmetsp:Transcript_15598/g.17992  ORF Transcript_15598/g.17992 Transcript_15598/m.17992 type:complete len:651 (-) Transcript_15598:76-2028(-)|eukprot:CAMPEP_0194132920 /NCGR_PEP_ID=MMETSP0152-20130528/3265_1 /TAXON_ID=1049557 /ORGANISM="Thalassiothrix antarctica, Strain L6-D1" /LENGTH=650 /DNA_ID=CAMNT_0038828117 /DNA_START=90 /DNA_END=2042 /DNA_ORIENTATION=-
MKILSPLFLLLTIVRGDVSTHRYKQDEHVELWVNKVGPYANPQEAYEYYTLPYCAPDTKHHPKRSDMEGGGKFNVLKIHSLGEHLGGHSLRHSGHDVTFTPGSTGKSESCSTEALSAPEAENFSKAVQHRWFYQMYLDDLPVWGMVGEMLPASGEGVEKKEKDDLQRLEHVNEISDADASSLKPYVYTSRNLIVSYNGDQIVKVDLTSDPKSLEEIKAGSKYTFKLFVSFVQTDEEFHSRFDRYLDHEFFKHPIHWFSVFNSFMMVLFLMGLVALILLRTLKKDYARYGLVHDLEDGEDEVDEDGKPLSGAEDSGWKQVHGDVFRAPSLLPVFAALLGTGWQLVVLTLGVIIFAVTGPLHGEVHEERGEVLHAILVCYSLSSIVAGYTSGQFFKQYFATTARNNKNNASTSLWQATMGLTVILLPTVVTAILTVLNTVSLIYGTINTIPFMAILKIFLLWIFVSVPLNILGTLLGRHAKIVGGGQFPCRVNAIPRPIPEEVPWYGKPSGLIPLAGLLCFGSIFIELYYVLTSLWNYKFYHVYGFLLGVYGILTIVVGMTSIIVVYFCLNAENYLWQWTAFASGASTAGYVFLYAIYYFLFKTQMNGFLQTAFYFGEMSLISITLGILCGTLGHAAASNFVRAIFQNVKVD